MQSRNIRGTALLSAATLLTVTAGFSQSASRGGLGDLRAYADVEGLTGSNICLGVVYLNGTLYVSAGDGDVATVTPHNVYAIDGGGNVTSFAQLETPATSGFGYRDGATDGTSIMFGNENGIYVLDPATGALATTISVGGVATILGSNPITGAGLAAIGNYRGLAYDEPTGRIWSGNFGSDIIEVDITGAVMNTLALDPVTPWSTYGLAFDSCNDSLWVNSAPNAGDIAEIDLTTGMLTGGGFNREQAGSAQGGLSMGPTLANGGSSFVALDQGVPDGVGTYRVHLYKAPFVDGVGEARLFTSVDGSVESDGHEIQVIRRGSVVTYGTSVPRGGDTFTPSMIAFNLGPNATTNGVTALIPGAILPEFHALSELSNPVGFALWGLTLVGTRPSITVPGGLLADGAPVRLQGMYPKVPESGGQGFLMATNERRLRYLSDDITVSAEGTNNLTTDRYWRISNSLGCQIDSITLDWVASTNAGQATMVFDTDQPLSSALGGQLYGGQNNVATCENSFRDGTDLATGLDYAGSAASTCDPTAGNLGYTPSNVTGVTTARTLTFNFTNFSSGDFIFDCDTDGGVGVTGDAMAGLVVTIVTPNGSLTGELAADPSTPNRAFIRFTNCP